MAMKKKPRPAISAPMSNKRAEEAKKALKIQAAKKAAAKGPAAKKKPKTGAAKTMTDAQLAAIGRAAVKKTKPKAKAKPKKKYGY